MRTNRCLGACASNQHRKGTLRFVTNTRIASSPHFKYKDLKFKSLTNVLVSMFNKGYRLALRELLQYNKNFHRVVELLPESHGRSIKLANRWHGRVITTETAQHG